VAWQRVPRKQDNVCEAALRNMQANLQAAVALCRHAREVTEQSEAVKSDECRACHPGASHSVRNSRIHAPCQNLSKRMRRDKDLVKLASESLDDYRITPSSTSAPSP
jgi:hypothetical protein